MKVQAVVVAALAVSGLAIQIGDDSKLSKPGSSAAGFQQEDDRNSSYWKHLFEHSLKTNKTRERLGQSSGRGSAGVPEPVGQSSGRGSAGVPEQVGLVVIDIQDCFTENGVGLGNPRGDSKYKQKVIDFVEKMKAKKVPIAILQDYHPNNHISFGTNVYGADWTWKPAADPDDDQFVPREWKYCNASLAWENVGWSSNETKYLPQHCVESEQPYTQQPLFPEHCVQGTPEVQLVDGLCEAAGGSTKGDTCDPQANKLLRVITKGTNPGVDSFGGIYDNRVVQGAIGPEDERADTGVFHFFQQHAVKHLVHIGIADDYCVFSTAALPDVQMLREEAGITSASVVPELTYGIVRQLADREAVGPGMGAAKKDQALVDDYEAQGVTVETIAETFARVGH